MGGGDGGGDGGGGDGGGDGGGGEGGGLGAGKETSAWVGVLTVSTVTPAEAKVVVSWLGETFRVFVTAVGFVVVMTMLITRLPATAVTEIIEASMPRADARAAMKAAWLKSETVPARVSCCVT